MVNGATSSINVTHPNETIANSFIVPVSNGVGVFTSNATHVIIDSKWLHDAVAGGATVS